MGYVYLIRNGDIYKIGITSNLKRRMQQLRPDEVLATREVSEPREWERKLHRYLRHRRIPQTEYFRLKPAEVEKVKRCLTPDHERTDWRHYQRSESDSTTKGPARDARYYADLFKEVIGEPFNEDGASVEPSVVDSSSDRSHGAVSGSYRFTNESAANQQTSSAPSQYRLGRQAPEVIDAPRTSSKGGSYHESGARTAHGYSVSGRYRLGARPSEVVGSPSYSGRVQDIQEDSSIDQDSATQADVCYDQPLDTIVHDPHDGSFIDIQVRPQQASRVWLAGIRLPFLRRHPNIEVASNNRLRKRNAGGPRISGGMLPHLMLLLMAPLIGLAAIPPLGIITIPLILLCVLVAVNLP